MYNKRIVMEIQIGFEKDILNGIERMESISGENLNQLLTSTKQIASSEVSDHCSGHCLLSQSVKGHWHFSVVQCKEDGRR